MQPDLANISNLKETPSEQDSLAKQPPSTEEKKVVDIEKGNLHPSLIVPPSAVMVSHLQTAFTQAAHFFDQTNITYGVTASLAGALSTLPYMTLTNKLIDQGGFPEFMRYPFLAGTMFTNGVLSTFWIMKFFLFERLLHSPTLKQLGIKTEGWSNFKHRSVLLCALITATPLAILSYAPNKSFLYNATMLPLQSLIYMTLQFFGTESILNLFESLYRKVFRYQPEAKQRIATQFIDFYKNAIDNLEEIIKTAETEALSLPYIEKMRQGIPAILKTDTPSQQKEEKTALILQTCLTNESLSQPRQKPKAYRVFTPIISLIASSLAAITTLGFFWDSKKSLNDMLNLDWLSWGISLFANIFFTCLIADVTGDIVRQTEDVIYRVNKDPLLIPDLEDRLQTSNTKHALIQATPYSMTHYPKASAVAGFISLTSSALSFPPSYNLQIIVVREWLLIAFMKKEPTYTIMNLLVCFFTILFNLTGFPATLSSAADWAVNNEVVFLLNGMRKQCEELSLAGAENVIAMFCEALGIPHCQTDEECSAYINRNLDTGNFLRLRKILFPEIPVRKSGYQALPDDELTVAQRDTLFSVLKSKVSRLPHTDSCYKEKEGSHTLKPLTQRLLM